MKIFFKSLFTLFVLFQATALYADDMRVVVAPFASEDDDSDLARTIAGTVAREVKQSKGFTYISLTDYVKAVTGDDKVGLTNFQDIESEYGAENVKRVKEAVSRHNNKPDKEKEAGFVALLTLADIEIEGKVERKRDFVKVEMKSVPMEIFPQDQDIYRTTVESKEDDLNIELRKAVKGLLEKLAAPESMERVRARRKDLADSMEEAAKESKGSAEKGGVLADKLVDREAAKVIYAVKATDGRYIEIEVVYTDDKPDADIQSVGILPPDGLDKNRMTTLGVKAQEGKMVAVKFDYARGMLDSVTVDTRIPDPAKDGDQSELLTLKSNAGYLIEFKFHWKGDGSSVTATVAPKINPFGDR